MPTLFASQVLTSVRTYLNDDNVTVWGDPLLIPKLQEAYRELQTKLWEVGSPAVRAVQSGIVVPIGTALLPAPLDLVCPFFLMEASPAPGADWVPMTEINDIETLSLSSVAPLAGRINFWSWRGEAVKLYPCAVARQVTIFYRRFFPTPTAATDFLLGVVDAELYLSARVAAMAAGSVGNEKVYEVMTALAKENFDRVVFSNRGQQKPVARP